MASPDRAARGLLPKPHPARAADLRPPPAGLPWWPSRPGQRHALLCSLQPGKGAARCRRIPGPAVAAADVPSPGGSRCAGQAQGRGTALCWGSAGFRERVEMKNKSPGGRVILTGPLAAGFLAVCWRYSLFNRPGREAGLRKRHGGLPSLYPAAAKDRRPAAGWRPPLPPGRAVE
jgi:hypothetical protein